MRVTTLLLLLALLAAPVLADEDSASAAFFARMMALDGRVFRGTTTFPTNPDHDMVGKPLELRFQASSPDELRVPFRVGDDASRTWILRRTPRGLLFKHDHRLADGSPDPITNYGGFAVPGLMSGVQVFPADQETATMLPEASTNVWCLQLSPDGRTLTYSLERHAKARYEARFTLVD